MPDPDADIELPVEDAVEQEQDVLDTPLQPTSAAPPPEPGSLEADEADVAEQMAVVDYGDDEYR